MNGSLLLQVFSTIDAAIDRFKRQPVNKDMQQAMPSQQQAYPYSVAGATAGPYSDPSYQAAAQYAGAPYDASAAGQYPAYPQQQYQQPYAATAVANGAAAPQGEPQPITFDDADAVAHVASF